MKLNLMQYIELVDFQARMSLKSESSRFYLGYLWWIIEPMLFVAVFYLVFEVILRSGRENYLVFLVCGKLPFVWFSKTITHASNSIINNAGVIGRMDVAKPLFPLAVVQEGVYKQASIFMLLAVIVLASGFNPTIQWLWLVPIILINYMLITACSLIASVIVCWVRDFSMLIPMAMILLLFTSGVFWDVRLLDPDMQNLVLNLNPLALLLDSYRQVFMLGVAPEIEKLLYLGLISLATTLSVLYAMNRASQWIAMRVLTA